MTNFSMRTLVTLACVATISFASAGDGRGAIEAQYRRLEKLITMKDTSGLNAITTSDFTWVDINGKTMNKKEFMAMQRQELKAPGLKFHHVIMKNDSYDFMGDTARVRSSTTVVVSFMSNGKRMGFMGTSEGVDTWRHGPHGWQCCKVEVVHETNKPLDMSKKKK